MAYTKAMRNAKKEQELKKVQEQESTDNKTSPTPEPINKKVTSRKTKRQIPLNTLVEVKNGFNGKLVFVSKKTVGYKVVFDNFGDTDYIELDELVSASNSQRSFFQKNWFIIDDYEILEFLNVSRFYENALDIDEFDEIFTKTDVEIAEIISKLSDGQKNTLIYRSRQLIDEGGIDSRKIIETLEKSLNVELIER
jgi:hypothetical protein